MTLEIPTEMLALGIAQVVAFGGHVLVLEKRLTRIETLLGVIRQLDMHKPEV